jgi:hypothetical protein
MESLHGMNIAEIKCGPILNVTPHGPTSGICVGLLSITLGVSKPRFSFEQTTAQQAQPSYKLPHHTTTHDQKASTHELDYQWRLYCLGSES